MYIINIIVMSTKIVLPLGTWYTFCLTKLIQSYVYAKRYLINVCIRFLFADIMHMFVIPEIRYHKAKY